MTVRRPQPTLQHVVNLVYDATLEPGLWPEAVASATAYTRSSFGVVFWRTKSGALGDFVVSTSGKELVKSWIAKCLETDPLQQIMRSPLDTAVRNADLEPRENLLRSERYRRYFRELNIEDRAVVLLSTGDVHSGSLSFGREDPYDLRSLQPLRDLSPHFRRALRISSRFNAQEVRKASFSAVLDQIRDGVFLLDGSGRVVWMNKEAERLLARRLLTVRNGQMVPLNIRERGDLSGLIQRAVLTGRGKAADPGSVMLLYDRDGTPHVRLTAAPLGIDPIGISMGRNPARAVVFVRNIEVAPRLSIKMLQTLYGLSPAEARLAADLAQGHKLQTLAERYGVRKGTVRAQLAAIFRRTGVRRQTDLMKLLLTVLN